MRAAIVVTFLAVLASGGWYGYHHWVSPPASVTYQTAEVKKGTVISSVSSTGTVEPLVKVVVGTQVSGTIMKWYADFNQKVQAGFVLAELDQDRFTAVLEQRKAAAAVAKAGVEEAQARLTMATMDRQRVERAYGQQAATEFERRNAKAQEDMARAALHAAEAQLQAAEADVQQAAVELDKTIIRSPIDGVVISRDVDEGQTVAATMQAPTVFTIANDLTKMRVNAAVSEMDIGKVHEGMKAQFRVDAYPDRRFRGLVSEVRYAEKVEDNVVTYTTLIDVDNPELLLRPGMTARILFEVDRAEDVLKVPNAALRFIPPAKPERGTGHVAQDRRSTSPCIYRLAKGELAKVPVTLGLNDGKYTAVTSADLKPGDAVVVAQDAGQETRRYRRGRR